MIFRKHVIESIGHHSTTAVISSSDGSPLKFPNIPGVSQETLALIHRQEAWPADSVSLEQRLKNRRGIMADMMEIDPKLYAASLAHRVTFTKEFVDTLEDHLADIERMRLRKRENRRKTTKKRKQRLMGKR